MPFENIILQSAGSLSVAILAMFMLILQTLFFFRKPQFTWYVWSAAISFSALLYAVGIFFEYNTPQGPLNRFSGILEFAALICLIHSLYGFTFSYLGIKSKRYHPIAGIWHGLILILLWSTDYIVAETFATWNFITLSSPYIEPALGPLGPAFELYIAIASAYALVLWIKHKGADSKHRIIYLMGMSFWILLGIHDGLASLGAPTIQYLMEYGFLGFAMALLWVVFDNYLEIKEEENYRAITNLTNDGILVIQDGKTVFGNPACCAVIGQPLKNSAARDLIDIVVSENRETALMYYNTLLNGGHVPSPYTIGIQRANGEQRFVKVVSSFIQYRNRPAILVIIQDITEQKQEEEALQESEEKLRRSKKMESVGLLAGGVAHDLNNILSVIIGYPELILMALPENSSLRKDIETIQSSGQKAVAIVQDLLTVARGEAIIKEPLNLNDIVSDYLKSPEFTKLAQFHPLVTFKINLDVDLFNISGSPIHLRRMVMNVVSNASEAIKNSGNVTISTMNRYVDRPIRRYDDVIKIGEYAILSVSDDGLGIPQGDLERIFEPFYTKRVMGRSGTGLGLAVVWNVVKDHKGYIEVMTSENGTTFKLYFPITRDEIPGKDLSISIEDYKGNGETILVVDDVESQREISCMILDMLGYKTKAVSSGEEAIEYLKDHTIDLILLDMIMDPGINGRETYERVIKIHPNQKAIIVSGFTEIEEVKAAQKLGAGQFVNKPFTLEEIGLAIKEELDK